MAFRESGEISETAVHETALKLDELVLGTDVVQLEKAIRFMSENTRQTLIRAIEKSKQE